MPKRSFNGVSISFVAYLRSKKREIYSSSSKHSARPATKSSNMFAKPVAMKIHENTDDCGTY